MLKVFWIWTVAIPAYSQVYKWVGENDVTSYGERPPHGRNALKIEAKPATPPSLQQAGQQSWLEKEREFRGRRVQTEIAEHKQKQETEQRASVAAWCVQARDRVRQIRDSRTVYDFDEKGERIYQSDAERGATIARHEQTIAQRCN